MLHEMLVQSEIGWLIYAGRKRLALELSQFPITYLIMSLACMRAIGQATSISSEPFLSA